jgi:hypothetical protein
MKTRVFAVCTVIFLFCSIVQADLKDGLVAYYPFNGNANDESGRGNNGIVYGTTLTVDRFGNPNSAYQFDGTSNWIKVMNSDTINIHGCTGLSIAAWVKADSLNNSTYPGIVSKWGPGGGEDDQYGIGIENGRLRFFLSDEPTLIYGVISTNNWYFVVGNYDYTTGIISLYINGIKSVQKSMSFCIWDTNQYVEIGRHAGSYYFDGAIDDIRIYNRTLSDSEVQQLYSGVSPLVIVKPYTFTSGTPAKAAEVNADLDILYQQINVLRTIVCADHPTANGCQ